MGKQQKRRKLRTSAVVLLVALILCAVVLVIYLIMGYLQDNNEISPGAQPIASSDVSQVSEASLLTVSVTDADRSLLMLVNKQNPLPASYSPSFTIVPTKYYIKDADFRLDSRAAPYMIAMLDAAKRDGINFGMVCGYRSNALQTTLYKDKISSEIQSGVASANAESAAAQVVAPPGYSEHETGLAADFGYSGRNDNLGENFEDTPAFTWLSTHAAEYGFILRYPKDKKAVTQYDYEPWHYRFVGVENAKKIKASGLCLEEYVSQIKSASSKTVKSTSAK